MKRLIYIIAIVATSLYSTLSLAQEHIVLMLDELPQSHSLNPAKAPIGGGYLTMPGLGGISVGFENTGFSLDDMYEQGADDSLRLNIDRLAEKMSSYNLTALNLDVPVLSTGFTVGKNFFSIDISNKTRFDLVFPSSVLDIRYGNYDYANERPTTMSFSDIYLRTYNYFEYAFGYSRQIGDRLRIGGRFKLLAGNFSLYAEDMSLTVDTKKDKSAYSLEISAQGDFKVAAPLEVSNDKEGYVEEVEFDDDNISINPMSNSGVAFDLGATLKVNDQITLGLSVLDMGFISWKENTHAFVSDKSFTFSGVDISGVVKDEPGNKIDDTYWEQIEDSLTQLADVKYQSGNFKTTLSAQVIANVAYRPFKWLLAGGVVSGKIINKRLYARVSANATLRARNWLAFIMSVSADPGNAISVGEGLVLTAPGFQFYVVADRIPMSLRYSRSGQIRFGFNFPIGRRKALKSMEGAVADMIATESNAPTM